MFVLQIAALFQQILNAFNLRVIISMIYSSVWGFTHTVSLSMAVIA